MADKPSNTPSEEPAQPPPPDPTEEVLKHAEATRQNAEVDRAAPGVVSEDSGGGGAALGSLI